METISKTKLAKRWHVSYTSIDNNVKKHNIKLENNKITMEEVKRHEDIIESGLYLPYTPFNKFLKKQNISIDPEAVSNYLTMQTLFVKRWYAGQYRIMKDDAIKVLRHFIGKNEDEIYKYLLQIL